MALLCIAAKPHLCTQHVCHLLSASDQHVVRSLRRVEVEATTCGTLDIFSPLSVMSCMVRACE